MNLCHITNIDNTSFDVEVLLCFFTTSIGKDYLIYTKHEADGNQEIIYVSRYKLDDENFVLYDIEDDEWNSVKIRIEKIVNSDLGTDISFITEIPDNLFNLSSTQKALRVTDQFIDILKSYGQINIKSKEAENSLFNFVSKEESAKANNNKNINELLEENKILKEQQQKLFEHIEELSIEIKSTNKKCEEILNKIMQEKRGKTAVMLKEDDNV